MFKRGGEIFCLRRAYSNAYWTLKIKLALLGEFGEKSFWPKSAILGQKMKNRPKSKFHFQHFLEMTHSWFLALIGLPSTIFVKEDPILRFWPNFHEIANFGENPPGNGRKKLFFTNFVNFLSIFG